MADTIRVSLEEVTKHFEELEDPRSDINQRHPLVSVAVISLMAVLAGANGPTAIAKWALLKKDLDAGEVYEYVIAGVRTEVLPQSCLIWTEDGLPAPWRHQTAGEAARF